MLESLFGQKVRRQENNMLDMEQTGRRIKQARAAKAMTQQELAEVMGVSYQAVSSWELGKTMPDISKVGELCEALGIDFDELLGNGRMKASAKTEQGREELSLKEEAAEERALSEEKDMSEEDSADWSRIMSLAPFLSTETLDGLVMKALDREKPDWDHLMGLAPFLSAETLDGLAEQALKEEHAGWEHIMSLAPFLSTETLDGLAEQALEEGKADWDNVQALAPFLSEWMLDKLVKQLM